MKFGRLFIVALAVFGIGVAASAGILDDALFSVDFGGDSVDDTSSLGGGLSSGTVDGTAAYVAYTAPTNSNGKGFSFDGSTGIDYGLGAGNELKIEGDMTYHVRVKYTGDFSATQFLMGRMGPTNGGTQRVTFLSTEYTSGSTFDKVAGLLSSDGNSSFGNGVSGVVETNMFYDLFFRFEADPDGAGPELGFLQTSVYETDGTLKVDSAYWSTGTTAQYDAADIMFWLGMRGDYSSTSPLTGVIDQANVWTQALTTAEMEEISGYEVVPAPPPGDAREILDSAIFNVNFGGDSVNDVNSNGGGLSTGTADPSITFADLPAMPNSNGRGAVLDGTGGIAYTLGAGNELKIEGSLTYHVRVKYTGGFSAEQALMGRFGDSDRVSYLTTAYRTGPDYDDVWGFGSTSGANNVGHSADDLITTDVFYDIFFRFSSDNDVPGMVNGYFSTAIWETGNTNQVGGSTTWWTSTTALFDSTTAFWLGARAHSSTAPLTGVIDQASVWTNALSGAEMAIIATENAVLEEPVILETTVISGDMVKLVVDAPSAAKYYYPEATTDLVSGTWTNDVAHSYTNTVGTMAITNLGYSSVDASGTNEVIYLQTTPAQQFFRIKGE